MKKILFIILFLIACNDSLSTENQDCNGEIIGGHCYGCTDPSACNWDPNASRFDDSCTYTPDGACDCDGSIYDCTGICDGNNNECFPDAPENLFATGTQSNIILTWDDSPSENDFFINAGRSLKCDDQTGWCFEQSTQQAFYYTNSILINGIEVTH